MPPVPDPVTVLADRLRRHEAALRAVPGVTGCGIGLESDGADRPVLQVFVADEGSTDAVARAAAGILGSTVFEVVVMSPPSADDRRVPGTRPRKGDP